MVRNAAGNRPRELGLAGEALVWFKAAVVAETGFRGGVWQEILRAFHHNHAAGGTAPFGSAGVHPINAGHVQGFQYCLPRRYVYHYSVQILNR